MLSFLIWASILCLVYWVVGALFVYYIPRWLKTKSVYATKGVASGLVFALFWLPYTTLVFLTWLGGVCEEGLLCLEPFVHDLVDSVAKKQDDAEEL